MKFLKKLVETVLNPRANLDELSTSEGSAPAGARGRLALRDVVFNLPLMIGLVIVLALFLLVLFGPIWAPKNPYIAGQHIVPHYDFERDEFISPPLPPSQEYPLGTDRWGNDMLSLLMHGARNTLVACAFITMVRVLLGLILGGIAGWNEGSTSDQIIMGMSGVVNSIPMLISSMILIFALDIRKGLVVFIVALSVVGWTEIAQYIRSEFLILRKMPYIEGAWSVGLRNLEIAVRHVLPNILPQLLIISFLEMGAVMMLLGELGFVGVYIGGGSEFAVEIDPFTVEIHQIIEVPEWGALLAEGFRWLRSKPFVVFPPALAFFAAVLGFNALGEGLRRLIERSGLNTAFLLSRRMILVVVAMSMATLFILSNTGAAPWFAKVAGAFAGEPAYQHVQALAEMEGRGIDEPGAAEATAYIAEKFEAYGLAPGGQSKSYLYQFSTQLVQPTTQPYLALLNANGSPAHEFQHQIDFGFNIEGHGGSGEAEAPLTFIGFEKPGSRYNWRSFKGLDVRGRIVLLLADNAPQDFATEALIRGAQGVLWIVDDERAAVRSQIQLADSAKPYMRQPVVPIFRVRPNVATTLLKQENRPLADLLALSDRATQRGENWFAYDLDTSVRMSLSLTSPRSVEAPCVLGYKQGTDYNIASEVLILLANYDGLGRGPDGTVFPGANHNASGVGVLLEIARLWQEQNLDTRRSVLFVAWGAGQLEEPGIEEFLTSSSNFRQLSKLRTRDPLKAAIVVEPVGLGAGDETIFIHPRSAENLTQLLTETAGEVGLKVSLEPNQTPDGEPLYTGSDIPWLYFSWTDSQVSPEQDTIERIEVTKLQSVGEALSLALTRIVRETEY